jgi:DNA mismatch repair protein MutL
VPPLFSPGSAPIDAAFQVFGTYLVAPQEKRLLIIDQHALHERITYERLKRELHRNRHSLQRLLVPINIELSPAEAKLIEEYLPLLDSIGLHIENFGGTTFIVTAICSFFNESKIEELLRHILAELEQGDLLESEERLRERLLVLSVSACHSSIRAGQPLSAEQRAGLIAGLRELTPPYTCPHGRPIMTELTLEELERSFRRR